MSEIKKKVNDILINSIGIEESEITEEANLIKDLGIDSLDYAELVMEFEQNFDIKIPDTDAEQLATVGQIYSYIEKNSN
ncbi:MAG: acyl carrier protein [Cytophagales bacterium]|nr:acyl carrier protein [Hyphobacterium sp. CCMP332]